MASKFSRSGFLFFGVIAFFLIGAPLILLFAFHNFQNYALTTQGKVVAQSHRNEIYITKYNPNQTSYIAETSTINFFDAQNKPQSFKTTYKFDPPLHIGDPVIVEYNPKNPSHAIILDPKIKRPPSFFTGLFNN